MIIGQDKPMTYTGDGTVISNYLRNNTMTQAEELLIKLNKYQLYNDRSRQEFTLKAINTALQKQREACAIVAADFLMKRYSNIPNSQYKEIKELIINADVK